MTWLRSIPRRYLVLGAVLVAALVAGAVLGSRSRSVPAVKVEARQDIAQGLSGASQQHRMGKAKATYTQERHDPATGAVTGKDTIALECEDDSEQEQSGAATQAASQAAAVTVAPQPAPSPLTWHLSGSARWDALKPSPSEVAIGLRRRVLGPVSVGAEVAANPDALLKPRVGATITVEW